MGEVVLVRNLDALTLGVRVGRTQPKDFARITTSTLASPARAMVAGRDPVLLAQQFLREHGGKFCPAPSELRPFQVERDELGMAHVRFEQRIGGLPVLGSGLIVHLGANGVVTSAGGRVAPRVRVPAAGPWALDADQAAQVAEQQAAAEGAAAPWQVRTLSGPFVHVATLHGGGGDEAGVVVWKVVLLAENEEVGGRTYLVDAQTGEIRFREEMTRGLNRRVTECANPSDICRTDSSYPEYPGYVFGRSEGQPARGSNPVPGFSGFDTDEVYDLIPILDGYWRTKFGRDGMNNRGGLANGSGGLADWSRTAVRVNIDARALDAGCARGASFTGANGTINLCHGKYREDTLGHEYSHGLPLYSITDGSGNPVGLTYQYESGALDEGQAYLWGERFELHRTDAVDWSYLRSNETRGQDVVSLANPPASNLTTRPDRFNSPIYYCGTDDGGGVHLNSTVITKAFYLMAEGGRFNGCTVRRLGTDAMSNLLYRAITRYYTPNTSFNAAYAAILQAATDLYPNDVAEVRKALQAVELDQAGFCSKQAPRIPQSLDLEGW